MSDEWQNERMIQKMMMNLKKAIGIENKASAPGRTRVQNCVLKTCWKVGWRLNK